MICFSSLLVLDLKTKTFEARKQRTQIRDRQLLCHFPPTLINHQIKCNTPLREKQLYCGARVDIFRLTLLGKRLMVDF